MDHRIMNRKRKVPWIGSGPIHCETRPAYLNHWLWHHVDPVPLDLGDLKPQLHRVLKRNRLRFRCPCVTWRYLKRVHVDIYIYVYVYIYIYTHEMISLDFFRTPRPYMTQLNEAPALYCTWKVAGPPHTAQHQTNQSDFVTPIIRVTQSGGSKLKGSHQLKTTTATTTTSTTKLWRIGKP